MSRKWKEFVHGYAEVARWIIMAVELVLYLYFAGTHMYLNAIKLHRKIHANTRKCAIVIVTN
jgi:hypothetical protein